MNPDWKALTRDERTTAIIGVWFEGASSTNIAEALSKSHAGKITRNGIIGLYHRISHWATVNHRGNPLAKYPLPTQAQGRVGVQTVKRMQSKARDKHRPKKLAALPRPSSDPASPSFPVDLVEVSSVGAEYDAAGRMLTAMQLNESTCRWSVAYVGRHLFCGHHTVTKSSYCAHHQRRATKGHHDVEQEP